MHRAKELLDQGNLAGAVSEAVLQVKTKPADVSARIFLFELLCFAGDLDRAEKQLEVVGHQSSEMLVGVSIYHQILEAERMRKKVFSDGILPAFLTSPPDYAALHLEALAMRREKKPEKARVLIERSLAMQPGVAGEADGSAFEEFEDSDLFLGPFLELIVNNRYAWLPFESIHRIEIHRPAHLRDLIWIGARLEARAGDLGEVFLPVLYPGSSENSRDEIRLGRMTDWEDLGAGLASGAGQRVFSVDGVERPMLEIGDIKFSDGGGQGTA